VCLHVHGSGVCVVNDVCMVCVVYGNFVCVLCGMWCVCSVHMVCVVRGLCCVGVRMCGVCGVCCE
jgi:hypothetical protein